jgi:glycosyltransferase involved in cell wall biosynthesis
MPAAPDVSVLIPTFRRPDKLAACIGHLARQTLDPGRFEVLVGVDGPDAASAAAALRGWTDDASAPARGGLRVFEYPREGYNAVRNRLLAEARGATLVSMNDDVTPAPDFLEVHHREQQAAIRRGQAAIVTGYSPFKVCADDSLFDRVVRETSMVFFYHRMVEPGRGGAASCREPLHDWGFRHCWGLNFSCPLGAVRDAGGFIAFPRLYGYDDIEIAWRLRRQSGMPVLFRPEALAEHDHRYSPRDVLEREHNLGVTAWHFARRQPGFCQEVFGRDIRSPDEVAYSRQFVARESRAAERLGATFESLASIPADAVGGPHAPAVINVLYEQHLLLKRWTWRRGYLEAAEQRSAAAA